MIGNQEEHGQPKTISKIAMLDHTVQTQFVDVAGGRIAYEVVGDGPLLVLSPGMVTLAAPTVSSRR